MAHHLQLEDFCHMLDFQINYTRQIWQFNIAIKNHLEWIFPVNMVIFHSYVKLPEGKPAFSHGFLMVFLWVFPFSYGFSYGFSYQLVVKDGAAPPVGSCAGNDPPALVVAAAAQRTPGPRTTTSPGGRVCVKTLLHVHTQIDIYIYIYICNVYIYIYIL